MKTGFQFEGAAEPERVRIQEPQGSIEYQGKVPRNLIQVSEPRLDSLVPMLIRLKAPVSVPRQRPMTRIRTEVGPLNRYPIRFRSRHHDAGSRSEAKAVSDPDPEGRLTNLKPSQVPDAAPR